jgi:hypothetical protein
MTTVKARRVTRSELLKDAEALANSVSLPTENGSYASTREKVIKQIAEETAKLVKASGGEIVEDVE